ncbi:hypothetical protein MMRN_p1190 (plasmid) [Mycobacterium marinum]|nr:hypothetical protein MMRN_p1190 [Mycobacterium marinum]
MLDPGNYPRTPRPPLGTVANEGAGRLVEAHRMATAVIGPWQVDPTLLDIGGEQAPTTALPDLGLLTTLVFGEALKAQAQPHHFVLGFASGRVSVTPRGRATTNRQTKDPRQRRTTFRQRARRRRGCGRNGHHDPGHTASADNRAGTCPPTEHRRPSRHAGQRGRSLGGGFEAVAFTARGPYVLFQFAGCKDNSADPVAALIAHTLDLQIPAIDHFEPTPVDQLAALPADPTGLLARTVPSADPDINHAAVYDPVAALHFRADPPATEKMYDDAGIQHVSVDRTTIYEAIDQTGALSAAQWLVRMDVPFLRYHSTDGINGLPSARCFDRGPSSPGLATLRYLCIASIDRYAFKATSAQEPDVHQVIAAQYLMLEAS